MFYTLHKVNKLVYINCKFFMQENKKSNNGASYDVTFQNYYTMRDWYIFSKQICDTNMVCCRDKITRDSTDTIVIINSSDQIGFLSSRCLDLSLLDTLL